MTELVSIVAFLVLSWACQACALSVFKLGSLHPDYRLYCFVAGNVVGVTGTWFMILLYRHMSVNVATGLLLGGGFLVSQLSMSIIYHSRVNLVQWAGIVCIAVGMALVAIYGTSTSANAG